MEVFHRRYFAFFAFLFIFASFAAIFISGGLKLLFLLISLCLSIVSLIGILVNKKHRFTFAVIAVSFIFICIAFLNSYFFISVPREKAEAYINSRDTVKLTVISKEAAGESSSEYTVRITNIGRDRVNIKSRFYCDNKSELSCGNEVIALCDIFDFDKSIGVERDILLSAYADGEVPMLVNREAEINYFSADGLAVLCDSIRGAFGNYVESLFGKQDGALVKGFLVNNTSDIPFSVHSDFKRSGTLHLLAVSGLHIALLMGSLDILLKKLFVHKKIRCFLVGLSAVFFLVLANFAASAVRSVLMLFAVYMNYLFSEDDDTPTALFVSVFLIMLFSPNSVYDLGMWMSFLATLGLVSVYPLFDKFVPRVKGKNNILSLLLRFCRAVASAVVLTLVANFFLLPIMWYFFGSVSLSSIPANLILSPLSSLYLPLSAVAVILGWIPLLNDILIWAVAVLGKLILYFADVFANLRGGVLSLRYPFVTVLVILFTVALAVLLVVKLKHKLWICVPALAFVLVFAVSIGIYKLNYKKSLEYVNKDNSEILLFDSGNSFSVCDISNGSLSAMEELYASIPSHAVELESYILTHAHRAHVYTLERFLVSYPIRTLYLPLSTDKEELVNITAIYLIAREYDTHVIFYESGRNIKLWGDTYLQPCFENIGSEHPSVYVNISNETNIFTYCDLSETISAIDKGSQSRYFLLGTHGATDSDTSSNTSVSEDTALIFATEERSRASKLKHTENSYLAPSQDGKIKFKLPLE